MLERLMMEITIQNVDLVRERAGLSYEDAVRYLKDANGDPVEALVKIERERSMRRQQLAAWGNKVLDQAKSVIEQGNKKRIRIRKDGDLVLEMPLTAGVVGTIISPWLAVAGAVTALATKCSVSLEDRPAVQAAPAPGAGPAAGPAAGPVAGSPQVS